jgi:cell wall-associated NlpC family hydrolase
MLKNVPEYPLLLFLCLFFMTSCQAFQPVSGGATRPTPPPSTSSPSSPPASNSVDARLRKDITEYAQKFVGTRYKYAGKDPKGFDCSGFTYYVMGNFDINISASSRMQENDGKPVDFRKVQPGDLIFFRRSPDTDVFHVALVIDNNEEGVYVVHSTTSRGVVIDNLYTNSYWKQKYATARDVIGQN